jgi:CBS domain-containing protein
MGQIMSTKTFDVMRQLSSIAVLHEKASLKKALDMMNEKQIGTACFVNESGKLIGVLTDGDLRRVILHKQSPLPALLVTSALSFGSITPITVQTTTNIETVREIMDTKCIWDIPVVNSENLLIGLVHRHNVG